MSKRTSKNVTTKLIGAGVGLSSMFVLTGCEEEVPSHAYESVEACIAADVYDDGFCETNWDNALRAHAEKAPRYESVEDCEKDFGEGQCARPETAVAQNTNDGGSGFFMPFMMGYMMGGNGNTAYSSPVYRTRNDGFRSLAGTSVSQRAFTTAGTAVKPSSVRAPSKAPTFTRGVSVTSRGGFGASGRGFSMGS